MIALPVAGVAADKVGRKTVTFLTVPVVLIAGVASSLPKDFHFYVGCGHRTVRGDGRACTATLGPPLRGLARAHGGTLRWGHFSSGRRNYSGNTVDRQPNEWRVEERSARAHGSHRPAASAVLHSERVPGLAISSRSHRGSRACNS
ncbi:hypothetical protein HPB48_003394 [Haemaphysalis longicornis]|uniref:Uncharacterized protein n=1 Tax=Haemaphysalis longicornis TaxID=44386 RepID=A0A9J6GEV8_HAELO|nr:hypothetical protein HPB48_003394 [Haemaphysalis longicornis]